MCKGLFILHQKLHLIYSQSILHTRLDSKGQEIWIMSALLDGQANDTHLETIGNSAWKQESFSKE